MDLPPVLAHFNSFLKALDVGDAPFFIGRVNDDGVWIERANELLRLSLGEPKIDLPVPASRYCTEENRLDSIRQAVESNRATVVPITLPPAGNVPQSVELQVLPLTNGYFAGIVNNLNRDRRLAQVFRSLDKVKAALDEEADVFYKAVLSAAIDSVPGTEAGSLWILEGRHFVCRAQYGFSNELVGSSVSYEDELSWYGLDEASFLMGIPRIIEPEDIVKRHEASQLSNQLPLFANPNELTNLLIPIVHRGQVLGTFNLDNLHRSRALTQDSVIAGQVFVREIVAYVESRRREHALQNRLELLDRIATVSRIARSAGSQGQLFMKILSSLREYTAAEEAAFALLSENGDALHIVASTSPDLTAGTRIPRATSASWTAIDESRVVFIPKARHDPRVLHYGPLPPEEAGDISVLAAPLTNVEGKTVGVLTINSHPGNNFSDEEIAFVEAVAESVGMSIERLQALGEATRRAAAYRKLLGLSSEIESIDSPREIAQRALQTILELTPFEAAVFYTIDKINDDKIKPEIIAGDYPSRFPRLYFESDVSLGDGLVGEAIANRENRAVYDYLEYPGAIREFQEIGARSVLVEPLWVKDTPYGALSLVTFTSPTLPSSEARNLLQLTARRIERAIERIGHLTSLKEAREAMLRAFGVALERRDYETQGHTERVTALSVELAAGLGFRGRDLEAIRWGAYLHDIGKLSIPDRILLKPGPLTDEEWELMKRHTEIGYDMLRPIPFLPDATRNIVRYHHERWDGSGYPSGLSGTDIPLEARIFAVVDVFDALAHDRPYKSGWPVHAAYEELERLAGKHLDPDIVRHFLKTASQKSAS